MSSTAIGLPRWSGGYVWHDHECSECQGYGFVNVAWKNPGEGLYIRCDYCEDGLITRTDCRCENCIAMWEGLAAHGSPDPAPCEDCDAMTRKIDNDGDFVCAECQDRRSRPFSPASEVVS